MGEKIKRFVINLASRYLVWIIITAVIIIWWFFPELIETLGKIILFWAPAIVLIVGFLISFGNRHYKAKKDEEYGISQYDLVVTNFDFFMVDIIIYGGALCILASGYLINPTSLSPIDLVQALIFFIFATWIKQILFNKISK